MRQLVRASTGIFAASICGVALLIACGSASAGPVLTGVSGTGHVHLTDVIDPHDSDKQGPITAGTSSVELIGFSKEDASVRWDISSEDSIGRLAVDLHAFGGLGGSGLAEATIRFTVDSPATYQLVMNFPEYGTRSDASIDGTKLGFFYNFQNPEPGGEKMATGFLAAGEHEFLASTFAGQTRSNPLLTNGTVTLNVTAAVIPLPAAVYPGGAVLIAMAVCGWRRRRALWNIPCS